MAAALALAIGTLLAAPRATPVLAAGSGITGLVTDESGTPLGGIHVEVCEISDCRESTTAVTSTAVSDGTNFRFGALAPGAYRVTFYDPTLTYAFGYLGAVGYVADLAFAAPVTVNLDTDGRADVRLPLANKLAGTIVNMDGVGLAGIDVLPLGPKTCVLPLGCLRVATAVDGTFTVRGLSRGTYTIRFGYTLGNAQGVRWYSMQGDGRDRAAATPVEISGSDVRIDATLALDADACSRPVEPFRGWTLVPYPYRCRNGSRRRTLIGGQELQSVSRGVPGFVALGWREFTIGAPAKPAAFTSEDGRTWTVIPVDAHVRGRLVTGHGMLVAVGPGTGGKSTDGVAWSVATLPPAARGTIVAATGDGPGFVAVGQRVVGGSHAAVWTSMNGLRWRQAPDQASFDRFCVQSVAGRASGFVAVGYDCHSANASAAVVLTSRDGRTWRRAAAQRAFSGNALLTSVGPGGDGFIAGGSHRPIGGQWGTSLWTSRDGISWRRVLRFKAAAPHWILRTAGGFVAFAAGSRAFVSRDGLAWSSAYAIPVPENVSGSTWQAFDAAASGSTVVLVGSYMELDGASRIEYGGLVWTGEPF